MDLYNALRCSDEEIAIATTTTTTIITSTTEEAETEPKVIIKNPQKMMEDIFDSLNSDVVIDSNRLEETNVEHKVDLDLMMGDQPITSEDEPEDKKILLKQPEKKEFFAKKSKQKLEKLKVKEDEPMMADAPGEEIVHSTDDTEQSTFIPTTDRQRRDANLLETTMSTTDASSTVESTENSNVEESSSTELPPSTPTEKQMTTTVTEEATTRLYVQGHPLHMSHTIFKEPIQPDTHGTHERIEIGESEDRFIPPMLLVKAKLTSTTTEVILTSTVDTASSTDQTIVEVTDIADENSTLSVTTQKSEMSNDIPSNETQSTQLENTITTVVASEKPILIEKRNDPRLGLKAATTSTQIIMSSTAEVTTVSEELTSLAAESTFESGTTTEETPVTELSDTSSVAVSDTFKPLEALVTASTSHHDEAEKLILLSTTAVAVEQTVEPSTTIISSPSPIALKQTTLKTPEINKSTTTMRNDIDAYHQTEDVSHEEDESSEHYQNNFSNADNYQPFKPNRHRSIKPVHHGPGFSIGKILG